MIKIKCKNCGETKTRNILPGKHAIAGAVSNTEKTANCCQTPRYTCLETIRKNQVTQKSKQLKLTTTA